MKSTRVLSAALGLTLTAATSSSLAATVNGRVLSENNTALAGAIVTLWNAEKNQKLSTYTDAQGYFHIDSDFSGELTLRGRNPYYRDSNIPLTLNISDTVEQLLVLSKMTDAQEISNSLPASAHLTRLNLNDAEDRETFISQCNFCHQQGNSLTRAPRDEEAWSATVWRMEGYGAMLSTPEHEKIVKTLHKGFNGEAIEVEQTHDFSPELAKATIHEWHVATPTSFLHDTMVGQNGNLYGIDESDDIIYELNRETDELIAHHIPNPENLPVGGNFVGTQLPIGIFTGKHGPHSGAQINDGRIFFTAALSSNLIEFEPRSGDFTLHPIPRGILWQKGLYSHTIRADKDNNVWFTVLASNMVLKFNTQTQEFTEIKLPANSFKKWVTDYAMGVILKIAARTPGENYQLEISPHKDEGNGRKVFNWPYGIDINPVDGGIWYAKLLGNKIGHIDPDTLEITEYDTPFKGPRRMRFGRDGILWIPSFDEGILMRFDPKTESFENIPLPLLSESEYEVPYALNVHEHTGDVWIAANNSDRVLRYVPDEKRFISYAMPSRVVWFRDFEFTKDGQVCTSNSNLPAYAHEDGVPAFFCINPEANH